MAQLPRNQSQFIAISGGMDLSTPPIAKASSDAVSTLNVQPIYGGGFSRIEGYECLDGKTVPSPIKSNSTIRHLLIAVNNTALLMC